MIFLETSRTILRQWQAGDIPRFAEMNADKTVMQYYPSVMSVLESENLVARFRRHIQQEGYGFFALELKESGEFLGFVGLNKPAYALPFSPCIEIGWRLAKEYWGKGYASEAAGKCLEFAFAVCNIPEIVSFTSLLNKKSQAVMERIGMTNTRYHFEHPALPENHVLREHVLYKITKPQFLNINN